MQALLGGLVAFAVVVGWVILRWATRGRDPSYIDDPSILLPAPPEGMTAATATIVSGGSAPTAFMAALFDLASRDEIAFRDETPDAKGAHRVGIEIRGGPADDARLLRDRRRPVGEGEAWLLANLRSFAAIDGPGPGGDEGAAEAMAAIAAFSELIATPTRDGQPGPDGLPGPLGKQAPLMELMREVMSDPAAVSADPQAFATRVEAATGRAPTDAEMDQLMAWLREHGPLLGRMRAAAGSAPGGGAYIDADRAVAFHPPLGFATLVESYARRNGWIAGLSFVARWKWRALAAAEVLVGLIVAGVDATDQQLVYGVGLGIAAGGLATWFVAPWMASRTHEGAVMKAELAAYRRTLKATFDSSTTLDHAATSARMTWLETPDQALVWGVALGLRPEIEALLRRTTDGMDAGTVPRSAFLPRWIGRAVAVATTVGSGISTQLSTAAGSSVPSTETRAAASAGAAADGGTAPADSTTPALGTDYAAVFAGIERIGTVSMPGTTRR
jgi:hypothetical protein